jgi:hypothetical protein
MKKLFIILSVLMIISPFLSIGQKNIKLVPFLKSNGKYIYVDSINMKPVLLKEFDEASLFNDDLAKVKIHNLYGYINSKGKEVVPVKYRYLSDFLGGFAEGEKDTIGNDRYYFIDSKGRRVSDTQFELESYLYARTQSQHGPISFYGDAVPTDKSSDNGKYINKVFFEGRSIIINNKDKFGVVDEKFNTIQPAVFDFIEDFYLGIARFKLNNKWGVLDKSGKILIKSSYDDLKRLYDGNFLFLMNEKYGVIDLNNNIIIPNNFDYIYLIKLNNFSYFQIKKNNLYGILDSNCKLILPIRFSDINAIPYKGSFLLELSKNEKKGLYNLSGKELIPCAYDQILGFYKDTIAININNHWYLNSINDPIQINYDDDYQSVTFFEGDIMWNVDKNRVFTILDANGIKLNQKVYQSISYPDHNFASVIVNEKYGVIDYKGNEVIKPNLENRRKEFTFFDGFVLVNKKFYVDTKGREFKYK